jgi:hypothetical protein
MRELGFEPLLEALGINGVMRTAIVGSITARMAAPGSELASHRWLVEQSYRYLVVSRERERHFDADRATTLVSAGEETIQVVQELAEDG